MSLQTSFRGSNVVMTINLGPMAKRHRRAIANGLAKAASHVEKAIKVKISLPGPRRGRLSKKDRERLKAAGETQRVSRPGEPPRRRTGNLRSSISQNRMDEGIRYRIGSHVVYARYLEWGTSKMAARPYFRPTLAEEKPAIVRYVVAAMRSS